MLAAPYCLNREMFYIPIIDWPHELWVLQSSYWGFVLVCALAAVFFSKPCQADSKVLRAIDMASGVLMGLAVLVVQAMVLGPSPHAFLVAMILCGAGTAWQYIRWGQCVVRVGLRRAVAYISCAFILAGSLKCIVSVLPAIRVAVDVALAVLAVAALRMRMGDSPDGTSVEATSKGESLSLGDIWLVPVAVALLSGSIGAVNAGRYITFGSSVGFQIPLASLLEIIAALTVWYWVCALKKPLSVIGILAAMAAVVATSCTLLATLGDRASDIAFFLTSVDNVLLTLFLWILLAALAQKIAKDPRYTFVVGWLVLSASALLGGLIAKTLLLKLDPAVCAVLMYVACMTLIAVIAGRNVSTSGIFSALSAEVPQDKGDLAQRCHELMEAHHLTAREAEVLELLANGRVTLRNCTSSKGNKYAAVFELDDSGEYVNLKFVEYAKTRRRKPKEG